VLARTGLIGEHWAMDPQTQNDDTSDDGGLLYGRVLDGVGGGRRISMAEATGWKPEMPGEVMWLHLKRTVPSLRQWLEQELGAPEPTLEMLLSDQTRPRAFCEGNTLVATLRGINFNPGAEPEDMITMQLWADGARVITFRRHALQTPRNVRDNIDQGNGPKDAGQLISQLVELMIARMSSSIVDMNEHIDLLEEQDITADDAERVLSKIATIRRNCLGLKRHMSPQHEALERIARDAPAWFEDDDRREIAESIDRLRRYLDDLDISKESAVVLMDDIRSRAISRSEQATYVLTIVAGIFLPLGFLTGLLGINVGGMPGVENADAFWVVATVCVGILCGLLLLFKRWKWL
jgi:zinc transporter